MKNILKVISVSFVMLLGIGTMTAQTLSQDETRPEVIAKKKSDLICQQLKLNDDQERSVYRAYVSKEVNYQKHVISKDLTDPKVQADRKKFDDVLDASMKQILTPAQYKQWLELQKV